MTLDITPDRQRILDATGHVLVTGGPGSGKTTIALLKAKVRIETGLGNGQSVLFLSFSRAAVARVQEAAQLELPRSMHEHLAVQTFHSFFWELLRTHGYLLGAPKKLGLLLPHDEAALRPDFEGNEAAWPTELDRLFAAEGVVAFDLFAPKTHALLAGSTRLCELVADRYPLIVVDEAQDTADEQWACARILAVRSQLVCLADLDQQIYDYRRDISPQRVTHIMEALSPLRVDLEVQNHRSPGREIVAFGNDILLETPRGGPYAGVAQGVYNPTAGHRDRAIRSSIGRVRQDIEAIKGAPVEGIALLASWRKGVALIARALAEDASRPRIPHTALIDEAPVLLSGRFIAFLLEPGDPADELRNLATAADLVASVLRAKGGATHLSQAAKIKLQAVRAREGVTPRGTEVGLKILTLMRDVRSIRFVGDPRIDWLTVRDRLKTSACGPLKIIAAEAEQLVILGRGRRLAGALVEAWQDYGNYFRARTSFDAAVAEDQILSGARDWKGVSVMTLHQSKGKEFDGVVIFEEPYSCPLLARGETAPYPRSRRLLRVGVTRARYQVRLLRSATTESPLLTGHRL